MGILMLIYGGVSLLIAGFGVAALYHARKFGYPGDKTGFATLIYLVLFGLILISTLVYLGSNAGETTL